MWVSCRVLLLVLGVLLVHFQVALRQGEFATPIAVTLESVGYEDTARARLFVYPITGPAEEVLPARPGDWECPRRCIRGVMLRFPEALQSSDGLVRLRIGAHAFTLSLKEFEPRQGVY